MSEKLAIELTNIMMKEIGYNAELKEKFGKVAKSFLRAWVKKHGYSGGLYWNRGGIAVSGEVIFKHEKFEIWISQSMVSIPPIMYRSLNNGVSGQNRFTGPFDFWNTSKEVFEIRMQMQPAIAFI